MIRTTLPPTARTARRAVLFAGLLVAVAACGGGGGLSGAATTGAPASDIAADVTTTPAAGTEPEAPSVTETPDPSAPETSVERAAPEGNLELLAPAVPDTFDLVDLSSVVLFPAALVTEPMIAFQSDGSFDNLLADRVETSDDQLGYLITLRDGVTFSDGSPLTPADVKYSYELHTSDDTESVIARYWAGVDSVEVVGDNQVEITLAAPDPEFSYTLSKTGITSMAYREAHVSDVGTPSTPTIGTGPYTYASFVTGTSVELVANPTYWGDTPRWETITMDVATDDSSRLLALQSGDYDGVLLPPLTQVEQIEGLGGYTAYQNSDVAVYRIAMDTSKAPFDDIHVRKALAHAMDRDALVAGAFGGRATIANGIVPEPTLAVLGDTDAVAAAYAGFAEDFVFDLDLAREELAQSSVPDGFSVEVAVPSSDATMSLVAQTIAQDLAEIGIDLEIVSQDDSTYFATVYGDHGADGLMIDSWNAGSPEPGNMPFAFFTPGSISNTSSIDDPAVAEAIAAYKAAPAGSPERLEHMLQALTLAHEHMGYIPLAYPDVYAFFREGLTFEGFNSFWWLTPLTYAVAG